MIEDVVKRKTAVGEIGTVVPNYRELADGTLRSILKQAKITAEEMLEKDQN